MYILGNKEKQEMELIILLYISIAVVLPYIKKKNPLTLEQKVPVM